jgi:hypothetical protein
MSQKYEEPPRGIGAATLLGRRSTLERISEKAVIVPDASRASAPRTAVARRSGMIAGWFADFMQTRSGCGKKSRSPRRG